jgi:small subunit ribosomal protein S9
MADEPTPDETPETPETPETSVSEQPAPATGFGPARPAAEFAEHLAVPTDDAAEIAGAVEDAPLEAFEEAQVARQPAAEQPTEEPIAVAPVAEEPAAEGPAAEGPPAEESAGEESAGEELVEEDDEEFEEPAPRVKPAVPGAHLEVDIVPEGVDPLGRDEPADPYAVEDEEPVEEGVQEEEEALAEPISTAAIDLAAGARYRATGKRKTAVARVTLRPGSGSYQINGRTLEEHFPRETLQRNIRQPLETVGYEERMDVVARLHGGGVSSQAGALRHGVSRALLEADPNLRGELKRRGFLTRDSRAKERKKAGLKKARKRPQFSKR